MRKPFTLCKYCKKTTITFMKINNNILPIEKDSLQPEDKRSILSGLVVPYDSSYMLIHLNRCPNYQTRPAVIPGHIFMRD